MKKFQLKYQRKRIQNQIEIYKILKMKFKYSDKLSIRILFNYMKFWNLHIVFIWFLNLEMTQNINQIHPKKVQSLIYLQQIVRGVSYLHENNIVHCKLRLDNIVLQNGKPKIIDFSEAIKMDKQVDKDYSKIKLSYQSPEMLTSLYYQFDGQKYDMWCLGLILYQMLQGQMPFNNITNNDDLKNKIKKSQFQINYPISQQVCSLLESMLNVDPNKRMTLKGLINFLNTQNLIFEDEYLKVPDDIPMHLIIKELEDNQIETINLFQQLEQNKHCSLTTCYYLIRNKLLKRAKLNRIKVNLMNFQNSNIGIVTNLRNSLQFTSNKSRIYNNGSRVNTENYNYSRAESSSQHSYQQRSLSKSNKNKIPFMKQIQQTQNFSQTQNSFSPSQNQTSINQNQNYISKGNINKSNNRCTQNHNIQELRIISDGYQMYQDKLQQRLKSLLYSNNNYIIQVTNTKKRSVSQKY